MGKKCSFCGTTGGHHSAECVDTNGKGYNQVTLTSPQAEKALLDSGAAVTKDGAVYINPESMRHDAEEYEACMMAMDEAGVPRCAENGMMLSIWGRACWMMRNRVNI